MKNILKLFIGLILFVMFSCHNITNSEQETLETDNHAYISISLNENARTVLPQSADFEKDFELSFELQGQQEGKDLQTIKKWTATTEKTAYTLMTEDASVLINTGLWNFELSVQKAGQKVLFGTLEEITIQAGTNTLNFGTLQNLTSGNGSVSVALSFAQEGRVQAVQGGLYNLDGTALEGFEKESLTITTSEKSEVRYNKENVPCGTYLVKFELFSDKEATKTMNVYTEIVQVATGFVSAAQRTLEQLNTLYTITYDLAEGEFVEGFTAQASFNQAMTVTLPTAENLKKTGYVFVGWKNDQGDTVTEIPVGTIGDLTLTAQWKINIYTISFNANGGTLTDNATQTVKHGEKIAEPSMPTREGYSFLGWYTSNDEGLTLGEIAYDFDLATIGDMYLYAKWIHVHTYSEDWTKDATHHWHAATCGHTTELSGKAAHTFGNWTVTKAATEESEGSKERTCTVCGYTSTEVIEKLAHTHKFATDWTSDATHHWHASTCGHTEEISGKAVHSFGNWTTTKEATCTQEGKKTVYCTVCEYEKEETIPAKGHSCGIWTTTKDPTETEKGKMESVCKVCGETVTKELEPAPKGFRFVKGGTVTGAAYTNNYAGVFIEGRTVTLSDFYMGKYEVTQEEYASVMEGQKVTVNGTDYALESNPSYCTVDSTSYTLFNGDVQEKRPVEGVTWYDAVWYCNALSEKEGLTKAYNIEVTEVLQGSGKTGYYIYEATVTLNANANGYRLPTEAEWEYAARGGDPTKEDWNYRFSGADTAEGVSYKSGKNAGLDSVGWYMCNSINGTTGDTEPSVGEQGYGTHQVGKKAPNRLGLYDMSGNVWEYCYDWYGTITTTTPADGSSGSFRVWRGGAWCSFANNASVSVRYKNRPYQRINNGGLRVVRPSSN